MVPRPPRPGPAATRPHSCHPRALSPPHSRSHRASCHRRRRARGDVGVALGRCAIAVPEQRPDDLLTGAHDGVAAAGGVAGAVAGDAANASPFREVAVPAIQHLREHANTRISALPGYQAALS
jgi:hypothetical protein